MASLAAKLNGHDEMADWESLSAICRMFTISYNGLGFPSPDIAKEDEQWEASKPRKSTKHIGETKAIANHDHDLIHEMSKRLDGVWRYDQYIANAEGNADL